MDGEAADRASIATDAARAWLALRADPCRDARRQRTGPLIRIPRDALLARRAFAARSAEPTFAAGAATHVDDEPILDVLREAIVDVHVDVAAASPFAALTALTADATGVTGLRRRRASSAATTHAT